MLNVKLSQKQKQMQVVHTVATFAIVLVFANTASAQAGGALVFLDKIREFFLAIVNHPVWPTVLGVWFLGSVVIYAKTHNVASLMSAIGAAAGAGIWVERSGVWSAITGYSF
jgi:hypothetical protein